ncbi:hypothetical protein Tco_0419010, partial [Tanacetum coccineum]
MFAYLQKSEGSEGFHHIVNFLNTCHIKYALIENPTINVSLIEQFWQTASTSTLKNGDMEITATIDMKVKVVFEASIRIHLKLEDSDGINTLPTTEIFEQLTLMGGRDTKIPQSSGPPGKVGDEAIDKELGDRMERAVTTASSLEVEQDSGSGPKCQYTILGGVEAQTRFEVASKWSINPPPSRVNTLGSGEDNMKLMKLMEHCTKLSEL